MNELGLALGRSAEVGFRDTVGFDVCFLDGVAVGFVGFDLVVLVV